MNLYKSGEKNISSKASQSGSTLKMSSDSCRSTLQNGWWFDISVVFSSLTPIVNIVALFLERIHAHLIIIDELHHPHDGRWKKWRRDTSCQRRTTSESETWKLLLKHWTKRVHALLFWMLSSGSQLVSNFELTLQHYFSFPCLCAIFFRVLQNIIWLLCDFLKIALRKKPVCSFGRKIKYFLFVVYN